MTIWMKKNYQITDGLESQDLPRQSASKAVAARTSPQPRFYQMTLTVKEKVNEGPIGLRNIEAKVEA